MSSAYNTQGGAGMFGGSNDGGVRGSKAGGGKGGWNEV